MNSHQQDPLLPDLEGEVRRSDSIEDWGHSPGLLDEDQRVYMPSSGSHASESSYEQSNKLAPLLEKLKGSKERVQSAYANFDREEALEKGRELITKQPWPAALLTFAFGAWLGHKITRRS